MDKRSARSKPAGRVVARNRPVDRRRVVQRDRNRVQSVQRGLAILRAFTPDTPKWGVTSLSSHLRLSKTIVTRLLATLEDANFVEQDPSDKTYYLGRSLYELAGTYANRNELIRISNDYLSLLVAQTGFTAQLSVLDGKEIVCLAAAESPMLIRAVFYPGLRRPAHATASGRVLLSGLADSAVRALLGSATLPAITSRTIVDVEILLKHLETVRRQGFAINAGESIEGLTAVAAPVRNYQTRTIAAVGLGFPNQFSADDQLPHVIQQVVNTAREISNRLGAYNFR